MRTPLRLLGVLGAVVLSVLLPARPASAHPLGNFTTNAYAGVEVEEKRVVVDYVVDLAEIPTLRVAQDVGGDGNGLVPAAAGQRYADERCPAYAAGLDLRVGGRPAPLRVVAAAFEQPPGAAGLFTTRVECELATGEVDLTRETPIELSDGNLSDRVGWREVTAVGIGVDLVSSDVPVATISARLRSYPVDRIASPLSQRTASLVVRPGEGTGVRARADDPGPTDAGRSDRLTRAFTSLVAEQRLTIPFALFAFGAAVLLGAAHSLAPGHGKTVIAAYLVSQSGSRRLASLLGLTVASTHTLAVLLLGTLVSASETVAPEKAYPWLGVVSGALFAGLGVMLFRRAWAARRRRRAAGGAPVARRPAVLVTTALGAPAGAARPHDHDHDHHHDHDHDHDHDHHFPTADEIGWRNVVFPGLAGGLVPSPSALLVYIAGLAIGRAWFGVALVLAYGVGIAATLVGAGYLLVRARARLVRGGRRGPLARMERVAVALPAVTAVLVVLGGAAIAYRAATQL